MKFLLTYSPVFVFLGWASWIEIFGRSDTAAVFWLLGLAVTMGLHVWVERRAKR